jgi:hypothetical protein
MHFAYFFLESLSYQLDRSVAQLPKAEILMQIPNHKNVTTRVRLISNSFKGSYHGNCVPDPDSYVDLDPR